MNHHPFVLLVLVLIVLIVLDVVHPERNTSDPSNLTIFANTQMTMQYQVVIGDSLTAKDKKVVQSIIDGVFSKINNTYNNWNPQSEISLLNNLKSGMKHPISKELANFLQETEAIVHISGGKFDPSITPLLTLWKDKLKNKQVPPEDEINTMAEAVGWHNFHTHEGLFWKDYDFSSLDLGGIVKGYAIDLIVEGLNNAGYANVFVEWGGEIRASGIHPEGRPWKVCVSKLGSLDSQIAIVDLNDAAIASSGDYFQNWTVEGVTYFHIIDPIKLAPLIANQNNICSVTVTAHTCMLADALATAAMLFPTAAESKRWLQGIEDLFPSISYWVMTRSDLSESAKKEAARAQDSSQSPMKASQRRENGLIIRRAAAFYCLPCLPLNVSSSHKPSRSNPNVFLKT